MKKLKWIVVAVVVIIVIAIGGVWLGIDGIVRSVVQTQATESLNLQTTLGGANVSLLGSSLGLSDLQIASPAGFSAPRMFTLGGVRVGVSVGKLRSDPIGVDQIVIDKPRLVIEQSGGKFNFKALMDQQSKQSADAGKPADGQRDAGEPIRLIVHEMTINNAEVVIRPGIPGMQNEITIPIPSLKLQNIGTGEGNQNGVAIKEVVMKAVTALAQKATESDLLPNEVRQMLSLNVDQVKAQLQMEVTKQVERVTKDLGKNLPPEATKAIEKGIGNLLNPKSDKPK